MPKRDQRIRKIHEILLEQYSSGNSPLAVFEKVRGRQPFRTLVAAILSSRTRDETTAPVTRRLFEKVESPHELRQLSEKQIRDLIYPVGFYKTKAKHLKALPGGLDRFGGKVPGTRKDLCSLPGVGPKVANLVLAEVFDKNAICVDTHVHRISNRLGLVKTSTPAQTEKRLQAVLPVKYWKTWNPLLVSHGQTICIPRSPRCEACPIEQYCRKIGVGERRDVGGLPF
jgi:endonuclease-3